MKYLKENFYDIVKLYINQVGITIFSFFLYTAVGMAEDKKLFFALGLAVSIFSSVFYIFLIHNVVWEIGAKDKIKIDTGRGEPTPHKGLFLAFFANVPNLILALGAVVFSSIMLGGGEWAMSPFAVFFLLLKLHAAMYMGMIGGTSYAGSVETDMTSLAGLQDCFIESILFLIIPLIAILLTQVSYYLGTNEIKLFGFFEKKKKNN